MRTPFEVHRRLPNYAATPLRDCPDIASAAGVAKVWVKDETSRLGLPSFKILGASYATYRALVQWVGGIPDEWSTIDGLRKELSGLPPLTLVAATDGNHGCAVARMARLLGLPALIYVPEELAQFRVDGIASEGAEVDVVPGDYDDAIRKVADTADARHLVVQDTSWEGYAEIPSWVVDGYATIFAEVSESLAAQGEPAPTLVLVPIGVGSLAAAAVDYYADGPRIIGVEPVNSACVLASLRAGEMVSVPGPHDSIMAGLNCGTPSPVSWPTLRDGLTDVVAIDDDLARAGIQALRAAGIPAGDTGGAGPGGLSALATQGRLDPGERVLLLCTEGQTIG